MDLVSGTAILVIHKADLADPKTLRKNECPVAKAAVTRSTPEWSKKANYSLHEIANSCTHLIVEF
jgi:hypothetical protein